jgi:hypothetical protein
LQRRLDDERMTHPEDVTGESAISVVGGGDESGGLHDGFEVYRTPAEEDYRALFPNGLVVTDTNVLLCLYRYPAHAEGTLGISRELTVADSSPPALPCPGRRGGSPRFRAVS